MMGSERREELLRVASRIAAGDHTAAQALALAKDLIEAVDAECTPEPRQLGPEQVELEVQRRIAAMAKAEVAKAARNMATVRVRPEPVAYLCHETGTLSLHPYPGWTPLFELERS